MSNDKAFERWLYTINSEQSCVLATILQDDLTKTSYDPLRMFISEKNEIISSIGDDHIQEQVTEIAKKKFNEKTPKSETITFLKHNGQEIKVFIDIYLPPMEIMIFGAGHDAIPVAQYSVSLGYRTTVVDGRSDYNNKELFPGTIRIVARHEAFTEEVYIGNRTYVIVMNHHLEKDQETLKFSLKSKSPYVGVLGPRSRQVGMIEAMQNEGVHFTESELKKMHSPIGLDIGANSPEEIAISILAEVIAVRKGHQAGFLQGSDVIHKASRKQLELID